MVPWLNWIEQPPPKGQVTGSNPVGTAMSIICCKCGKYAQFKKENGKKEPFMVFCKFLVKQRKFIHSGDLGVLFALENNINGLRYS